MIFTYTIDNLVEGSSQYDHDEEFVHILDYQKLQEQLKEASRLFERCLSPEEGLCDLGLEKQVSEWLEKYKKDES